jgi:protein associated with RNAse G/E
MSKFIEYKHTYFGSTTAFPCFLIERKEESLILGFKPEKPIQYIGINFPVGSVSIGYYWTGRNYNVYHWKDPGGKTLLYYVNVSKDTKIGDDRIDWLDLIVDVAGKPGEEPRILDFEEVPPNMPANDMKIIGDTIKWILSNFAKLSEALETRAKEIDSKFKLFGPST